MVKKHKVATFLAAAIVGLLACGTSAATAEEPVQEKDAIFRLSFHELIECIDSSDMEPHWLTSGHDLQLGIVAELDAYLQENFSPGKHIRSEDLHVTLHDSIHEIRSFLRQQGDQDGGCPFGLELTGDIIFGFGNETTNTTPFVKSPEERCFSLEARCAKIYARILNSIVNNSDHLAMTAPETTALTATRNLQLVCTSVIKSTYAFSPDEFLCSPSGLFFFGYSADGDLGIWKGWRQVWSAGTQSKGIKVMLQGDGNLVVRNGTGSSLWNSRTGGSTASGGEVKIADSGEVTVLNAVTKKSLNILPKLDNLKDCITELKGISRLKSGDRICSRNERYSFGLSARGDLGIWFGPKQLWSAGTCCKGNGTYAILQADGNFVVRSANGDVLWKSGTDGSGSAGAVANVSNAGIVTIANTKDAKIVTIEPSGEMRIVGSCVKQVTGKIKLQAGRFICSPNGKYRFGAALSGDLQLLDGSSVIWSAGTNAGVYMQMQGDGNLVFRNGNNQALWTSKTGGNYGASLSLTDDGAATILSLEGKKLWAVSGNSGPPPQPVQPPLTTPTPKPSVKLFPPTIRPGSPPTPPPSPPMPPPSPSPKPCLNPVVGQAVLTKGDFFCSPNKQFKFGVAFDGDLALFEGSRKIWSAKTCCTGEEVNATLQADGNLVVKTSSSKVLWNSQSSSLDTDIVSLIIADDGIVTITDTKMGHVWSSAVNDKDRVAPNSLQAKVMAGYQGWFFARGDGALNQWVHWTKFNQVPNKDTITIDPWPDLSELDDDELYPTDLRYKDGSTAGLYSAYNTKTVERHTRWMKDYGVDGVFVQRFIGTARAKHWTPVIDKMLANVRSGAEKYGRTFVTMYDIGNGNATTIVQDIINDWKHLVDDEHITKSKQYLRHRGRPLLAIWGFGVHDRLGTPAQVAEIIDWFKNKAESKYQVTLMGGVPAGWRDLSRDSKTAAAWASIYRSYDVISPWTVGRYGDIHTANIHRSRYIEPDMAECKSLGIDYLPVVFPGFSFNNKRPDKPFNEIPRNGGTFMWQQMYNAVAAGNKMIYVAMFDEVDEGTAIFKLAQNLQQTPTEGRFLTTNLDQGYSNCPNDWYLNISGLVSGFLRQGKDVPLNMPAYP